MRYILACVCFILGLREAGAHDVPISGRETIIGSWDVLIDRDPLSGRPRAIATLDDYGRQWSLMVRCVDGQIGILVRPYEQPDQDGDKIERYEASFRSDRSASIRVEAQTFSAGGILIPDATPIMPAIEAGSHLEFAFVGNDNSRFEVVFDASDTRAALAPVRRACAAAEG